MQVADAACEGYSCRSGEGSGYGGRAQGKLRGSRLIGVGLLCSQAETRERLIRLSSSVCARSLPGRSCCGRGKGKGVPATLAGGALDDRFRMRAQWGVHRASFGSCINISF